MGRLRRNLRSLALMRGPTRREAFNRTKFVWPRHLGPAAWQALGLRSRNASGPAPVERRPHYRSPSLCHGAGANARATSWLQNVRARLSMAQLSADRRRVGGASS